MALSVVRNGGAATQLTTDAAGAARRRARSVQDRAMTLKGSELVHPFLTLKRTVGEDGSLAFGSVTVATAFGMPLIVDNVNVKVDKDGDIRVSLPFKAKATKDSPGKLIETEDGYRGYCIKGKPDYVTLVRGDGAYEVQRAVASCYMICSVCTKCTVKTKDTPAGVVETEFMGCNVENGVTWSAVEVDGVIKMVCSDHEQADAPVQTKAETTVSDDAQTEALAVATEAIAQML